MTVNLFDPNFYRAFNPDLSGLNDAQAFQHLLDLGLNEGRTFSQYVDLNLYRTNNPDLAAAGLTTNLQLFDHLSAFGVAEGRTFSLVFNANFYRAANPDLAAAGLSNEQLFDHFRGFGINEGRQASESFSANFYLTANPDLQAAGFNLQQALQHYVFSGIAEGRIAAPGGVTATPPAQLGNSTNNPFDLGILTERSSGSGFVSQADIVDYYRFILTEPRNVSVTLNNPRDDATVSVLQDTDGTDGDGDIFFVNDEVFGLSSNFSLIVESIEDIPLQPGTYFIRVASGFVLADDLPDLVPDDPSPSSYDLQLSSTPSTISGNAPDGVGNTWLTAFDAGTLSGTRRFNEFVGSTDYADYYRFNLSDPSHVNISLRGSGFATLTLFRDTNLNSRNESGELVQFQGFVGSANANISDFLRPGTYFVLVDSRGATDTNYTLTLTGSDAPSPRTIPRDILTNDALEGASDNNADSFNAALSQSDLSLTDSLDNNGSASLIQDFTAGNPVDSGSLASNNLNGSTLDSLVAVESLAGETNFTEVLTGNGLDSFAVV
ncbi:MAG: hypothetical protein F6J93_18395 [Oscillatoria sp. SIO1A7]|nr:hypothetical protein [Oscillatoria sp. SIO1A7]